MNSSRVRSLWLSGATALLGLLAARPAPGQYLTEFPLSSRFYLSFAIATAPDGNFWFASRVADDAGHDRIARMTPSGQLSEYSVPSRYAQVTAIAFGPDGSLWFTELLAGKIGRIDAGGEIREYELPVRDFGYYTQTASPTDLSVDGDGNIWFTEASFDRIGRMSPLGELTEFALPDFGNRPTPLDISCGPDGMIWYTTGPEPIWPVLGRLDSAGRTTDYTVSRVAHLDDVLATPDGTIWFTGSSGYGLPSSPIFDSSIGYLFSDGRFAELRLPDPSSAARGLILGPDGDVWFIERSAIGRVTKDLELTEFPLAPGDFAGGITFDLDGNAWVLKTNLHGQPAIARLNPRPGCRPCARTVPFRRPPGR